MSLVVFAFAPGLFWLWFFVRKDVYRPEPRRLLALTFFLGMAATIPAVIVEAIFIDESILSDNTTLASITVVMLFVVGPAEELSKFAVVRLVPYRSLYFDEPIDGLVYAAAASLGFASLENLGYILEFGPGVMLLRAPLSTLAHVIFGSIWGYVLGLHTQGRAPGPAQVVASVGMAAAVHAVFNVSVFIFWPVSILVVIIGATWTIRRFNWAQRVSPFRYKRNFPQIECAGCSQRINVTSRYCHFCSTPVPSQHNALFCSNCKIRNRPDASYCTRCGDRLLV